MIINHLDKLNFENIFNSLPVSILIIDKNLKILYANLTAKEELNFDDRLSFKNIENIFNQDNLLVDTIKRVKKEKKPISIEKINLTGFNFFSPNNDIYVSIYDEKFEYYLVLLSRHTFIPNKEIPDNSLVMGSPGKIIRKVSDDEAKSITKNAERYQDNWKKYSKSIF